MKLLESIDWQNLYESVCRTNLTLPGFYFLDFGTQVTSREFRSCMSDLWKRLNQQHQLKRPTQQLSLTTLDRFDQQNSTKPHRDSGPTESLLVLGYEPSKVASEITLYDYSRCARDMKQSPSKWLEDHNPMFGDLGQLSDYAIRLDQFSSDRYQLLIINNSVGDLQGHPLQWQGLLHSATIASPNPKKKRVINSAQLAPIHSEATPAVSEEQRIDFLSA